MFNTVAYLIDSYMNNAEDSFCRGLEASTTTKKTHFKIARDYVERAIGLQVCADIDQIPTDWDTISLIDISVWLLRYC